DGGARILVQEIRRAMRGNDAGFEGDAELREGLGGVHHRGPVRAGPHDDADQWFHRRIVQQLEFASHSLLGLATWNTSQLPNLCRPSLRKRSRSRAGKAPIK